MVIGVGLPRLSFENDIIKDYFDRTGKRGYDYAYVYPGMNKVSQAGGRLIRSEQDSGTLTLVDDRFLNRQYGIFGAGGVEALQANLIFHEMLTPGNTTPIIRIY